MILVRRHFLRQISLLVGLLILPVHADDRGKDVLGQLKVGVYFGTDSATTPSGVETKALEAKTLALLQAQKQLKFANYLSLGSDTKPVYRSYENWAEPLPGSQEILCRFEIENYHGPGHLRLNLELWLQQKKVLKSGIVVSPEKPVLIVGPSWRDGRIIIAVELLKPTPPGPGQQPAQ